MIFWAIHLFNLIPYLMANELETEEEAIVPYDIDTYYANYYYSGLVDDFSITINGRIIDMTSIASNGKVDTTTGIKLQRVFAFEDTGPENIDIATYYFRVPIAGRPQIPKMMHDAAFSWDKDKTFGDISFDAVALTGSGRSVKEPLGLYDGSSWKQLVDGSLQVSYVNDVGTLCPRQMIAIFKCSLTATLVYEHSENPTCYHHVNVSSSLFCSAAYLPTPGPPPTRSPTQVPFVIPILQASSQTAPGNYCISLFLENNTVSAWNSTAMDVLNVDKIPYYTLKAGCSLPYANSQYCFSTNIAMPGKYLITRVAVFKDDNYWLITWKAKNGTSSVFTGNQITPMVYAEKPPAVNGKVTSKFFVGACK